MDYTKIIETVPTEKWAPLSNQLTSVILNSKNDEKMPSQLANTILQHMKNNTANTKPALAALLQAAILLDAEKTVVALGELQMLKVAEHIVQNM
jgi:hypothetical protein